MNLRKISSFVPLTYDGNADTFHEITAKPVLNDRRNERNESACKEQGFSCGIFYG